MPISQIQDQESGLSVRTKLNQVIDYTNTYKIYVAQVSQTGTNAPVANVLQDNTGLPIVWNRINQGAYELNFGTQVPLNKLYIPGISNYVSAPNGFIIPLSDQASINGHLQIYVLHNGSGIATGIEFDFTNATFDQYPEWSTLLGSSDIYFEFRIYS